MEQTYSAAHSRYERMEYTRCGESGLLLPRISLGFWHNFGESDDDLMGQRMVFSAFDQGITYFDLANNYGPPPGSAEERFGNILHNHLRGYRDEMLIATKAGHAMWSGPYGDWGSRKSLIASIDQSLRRLRLEYVDIFYSHRYDPQTPLEETMMALADIVTKGKALYVGLSKYPADKLKEAVVLLRREHVPVVVHQVRYSMFVREPEMELLELHQSLGLGTISFSPLAGGLLSGKYLSGIPIHSRAAGNSPFLTPETVMSRMQQIKALNEVALSRGQTLSQMAIAWQLYDNRVSSVLCGASSPEQIQENIGALSNIQFSSSELTRISEILK